MLQRCYSGSSSVVVAVKKVVVVKRYGEGGAYAKSCANAVGVAGSKGA